MSTEPDSVRSRLFRKFSWMGYAPGIVLGLILILNYNFKFLWLPFNADSVVFHFGAYPITAAKALGAIIIFDVIGLAILYTVKPLKVPGE